MRQSLATKATYWLKVVSLGMVLGLGLQFAQAWVAPAAAPPAGNVAGPITTGASSQAKSGGLTLGGLLLSGKSNCDLKTTATGLVTCGVDATASGGGDNLGNHIATQAVNMNANRIYGLAGGGGNSIGWGSSAGTGNGIYSDGANGNMAVRTSGTFFVQNQAGNGAANINTGYMYSSSTIDAQDYWIRAAGKWASQLGGGGAKAWVSYSGGVLSSYGVGGVTPSSYNPTINLSPALSSANYVVVCNATLGSGAEEQVFAYGKTASSFYLRAAHGGGADPISSFDCVVFGN